MPNMPPLSSPSNSSMSSNSIHRLPPYTPQNPFRLDAVENPWTPRGWKCIRSVTSSIRGLEVTDEILHECAVLFNNNFGVWSELAQEFETRAKAGSPVKTTVKGLRKQCVPCESACTLARYHVEGKLVGYAFATRWPYRKLKGNVCWITQIVVDQNYRGLKIATRLLEKLKSDKDVLFGIIASHPAALMALAKTAAGISISSLDLRFAQKHTAHVLRQSNIEYLRSTKLHGSLFMTPDDDEDDKEDGTVACAESNFYMDHDEALQALDYLESHKGVEWPLGDLLDRYEFTILVENKNRVVRSG